MKPKFQFELYRWIYFVLFWFIAMGLGIIIIEIIAGPVFQWLLYDAPYQLPTWDRAKRWALGILFIGFFAGTISWYAEKRSSGR
jgi:hypothetical protein